MPVITVRDLEDDYTGNTRRGKPDPAAAPATADPVLVGDSVAMQKVRSELLRAAQGVLNVLLVGDPGTGKRVAAQLLHRWSSRAAGPFVEVHVNALTPATVHSELYGHQAGDFPGAVHDRLGKAELAKGGTLFLDGVDTMVREIQGCLSPIVKDGHYEERGTYRWRPLEARLVAAAGTGLEQAVQEGRFRRDLYHGLLGYVIRLPALRDHREDLPLLVDYLLRRNVVRFGVEPTTLGPAAVDLLQAYDWPGNVRELERVLAVAMARAKGSPIQPENIEFPQTSQTDPGASTRQWSSLVEHQRQYIAEVLAHTHGVVKGPHGAARILQINEATLRHRMHKLGLRPRGPRTCPSP